MTSIEPAITVTMEHRKAQSACHAAPLNLPTELELTSGAFDATPDGERFTCSACGQPAARVLGEPVTVVASNG